MTQTITVDGSDRSSKIRRETCEWTDSAYLGEVGAGRFVIDDASGNISPVGHRTITVVQDAGATVRLWTGFVGRKTISRGELQTGTLGREVAVTTNDLNDLLNRYIIWDTDGKRSAETVGERITWLLASDYLSPLVTDEGAVTYPSDLGMDATDYRGQRPGDVLAACAKKANFNYYVRWNTAAAGPELVFRDDNASTDDTSTISISNVASEINGTSVFPPFQDVALEVNPEDVYSDVYASYAKGAVTETRAATASAFVTRWGTTDDSGIKTSASAHNEAEQFLWESHTEEHTLTVTLRMRAAYVNLIRAGMRVAVKLTHLAEEAYGTSTYFRVLRRRVTQPLNTDNDYDVAMDLSPQESGPPAAGIVQQVSGHTGEGGANFSFPNLVTIGSLLVYAISDKSTANPPAPSTSSAQPRWGGGAWTKLPNSTADLGYGAQPDGVAIWYKVADATDRTGRVTSSNAAITCYEVVGGDIASAVTQFKHRQAAANPMTIGSLGTPVAGSVAIMVGAWLDASSGPPSPPDPEYIPATGWTRDLLYWERGTPPYWGPPVSYIAHQITDGSAVSASGMRGPLYWMSGAWCGAAVLIPPL